MSEQTPIVEDRAKLSRLNAVAEAYGVTRDGDWGEEEFEGMLAFHGYAMIDSEELTRLRQAAADRDVSMKFVWMWKYEQEEAGVILPTLMGSWQAVKPAYDRWQAEQARGEEAGR